MPNKVACVVSAWLGSWVKGCQIASIQNNLAMGICPFKLPWEVAKFVTRKLNPTMPEKASAYRFSCAQEGFSPGQWHFPSL